MINQRATRPQAWPEVVSIADLAMFACEDDPMRTTDEALEHCPLTYWRAAGDRMDPVTAEDHWRWVRIQTRGHWESGTYYGPTYTRIYLGPVEEPKPSTNPA